MKKLHMLTTIKHRSVMAVAAAVTGTVLLTSGGAASAMSQSGSHDTSHDYMPKHSMPAEHTEAESNYSQAAVDLRVAMNNLLREHVSVSLDATRSIVDGDSNHQIEAATNAQYANADDLAAAVGSIYGEDAQHQFSELFNEHIAESNKYAIAVGDDDDEQKQAANEELQSYLTQIADFFSGAIPGLASDDVYALLEEHENLINESTQAYYDGDYQASYELERDALTQISGAADALSAGIIATQPAKFE